MIDLVQMPIDLGSLVTSTFFIHRHNLLDNKFMASIFNILFDLGIGLL
jgi:hypothetical protein